MDKLRSKLLKRCYKLKLTKEESKTARKTRITVFRNSSWLIQDRGKLQYTHPAYRGPFTKENVADDHIYCSLEMWEALGMNPIGHWDYRGCNGRNSYNPAPGEKLVQCHMYLPIIQRAKIWWISSLKREIFDDLTPVYG